MEKKILLLEFNETENNFHVLFMNQNSICLTTVQSLMIMSEILHYKKDFFLATSFKMEPF